MPDRPSKEHYSAIETARRLHPSWDIRVWKDEEVEGGLLHRYLPRVNSGAQFADLVRLDAVLVHGGVYLDSDMRLLRALGGLLDQDAFLVATEDGSHLTNAFFAAPPWHAAIRAVIDRLLAREPDWTQPANETTGPNLFTSVLAVRGDVKVLPRESFYPYGYAEERPDLLPPAGFGVHEWASSWLSPEQKRNVERETRPRLGTRFRKSMGAMVSDLTARAGRAVSGADPSSRARPYSTSGDVVVRTVFNLDMLLPGGEMDETPALVFAGTSDLPVESFIAGVVRGGDWVVDVGAGLGVHTLIAASRCGPFGRVFAFESDPGSAGRIRVSVRMNRFSERVRFPMQARLGGGQTTEVNKSTAGSRCFSEGLDEEFPLDMPIKLLRLGAEQNAAEILAGADRMFASRSVEHLLVKVRMDAEDFVDRARALERILEHGYCVHSLSLDGKLSRGESRLDGLQPQGAVSLVFKARW